MATERVLSARELNRALLARQLLLERSSLPLVQTIERIGGLQTQYAPSGYIGLWSRMRNFRREALTSALEQRRVIQGTLLRGTIHMVSARDYWLFLAATRQPRQEWWRRITQKQFGDLDMAAAAGALREQLATGLRRADEFKRRAGGAGLGAGNLGRRRTLAPYSSRSAVGHLGAAQGRRLRSCGNLDPAGRPHRVSRTGARHPPLPGCLRPRIHPRNWRLGRRPTHDVTSGARADIPPTLPRREGERAHRPSAGALARCRDARSCPLLANLGRDAAGARAAHPDPPRALSPARLQYEDPTLGSHPPGRRRRRGDMALRGRTSRDQTVRADPEVRAGCRRP